MFVDTKEVSFAQVDLAKGFGVWGWNFKKKKYEELKSFATYEEADAFAHEKSYRFVKYFLVHEDEDELEELEA